jgi:hypothetical protein
VPLHAEDLTRVCRAATLGLTRCSYRHLGVAHDPGCPFPSGATAATNRVLRPLGHGVLARRGAWLHHRRFRLVGVTTCRRWASRRQLNRPATDRLSRRTSRSSSRGRFRSFGVHVACRPRLLSSTVRLQKTWLDGASGMGMFCSKCGKELPDDAVVCVGCGRQVMPLQGAKSSSGRSSLPVLLAVILGGVVVLNLICGAGLYLFGVLPGLGAKNDVGNAAPVRTQTDTGNTAPVRTRTGAGKAAPVRTP